ncbi:hypothetical protein GMSM_35220 [Geomonas sp. Red276]
MNESNPRRTGPPLPPGRSAVSASRSLLLLFIYIAALSLIPCRTAKALVCSVPGQDGPASVSGIVNTYYAGRSNTSVPAGSTAVPVGSIDTSSGGASTPFAAGDLALVIQMQDADISYSNDASYGGSGGGAGYTSLNSTGLYEYVVAAGPVTLGSLPITSPLVNSYRSADASAVSGQRRYQVIRVPQYSSATLAGQVNAAAWNGTTGGVVAFDVAGQLNWNGRVVNASGRGFRGAAGLTAMGDASQPTTTVPPNAAPNVYASPAPAVGAVPYSGQCTNCYDGGKGEGIAGTPRFLYIPAVPENGVRYDSGSTYLSNFADGYPGGSYSRGAPGNAGGGGSDGNLNDNDENTGGGGGGAYSSGGMGGYGWTPNTPPGAQTGGIGGYSVPLAPGRLTMGGGGGAGTTNNGTGPLPTGLTSSGAPGGGIVLIRTATAIGSATINANGAPGAWDPNGNVPSSSYTPRIVCNDAAGGGGGGGSVLIFASNSNVGTLTINASGGNGGNNTGTAGCGVCTATNCPHGPGGGGSGGFVALTTSTGVTVNVAGGASGLSSGSPTSTPPYGSSSSSGGFQVYTIPPVSMPGASVDAMCYPSLTVSKVTGQANAVRGGTTTYTITVTNQTGYGTATGVTINDTLPGAPSPFTYASTGTVTLAGGATRTSTSTPAAGASSPSWGKFSIPGGGSVSVTFTVSIPAGTNLATYQNSATVTYDDPTRTTAGQTVTPGGTYAEGGTVAGSNYSSGSSTQEDVTVWMPATVTKNFTPAAIEAGGSSVLSISITNPNSTAVSNASFTDSYPSGLSNSTTPGAAFTAASLAAGCSGTLTALAGGGSLGLSLGAIPAGTTCTMTVNVTFTTATSYTNTFAAQSFANNLNVTNLTAASATLLAKPIIVKSFSPLAVNTGVNSTLSFAVTNPNATGNDLHAVGFSDSFPSGFLGGSPNGGQLVATGGAITVTGTGCSGFAPTTIAANATTLTVSGGTVPAGTTCTISFPVKSATTGYYPNTVTGVSSTETGAAGSGSSAALGVGVITVGEAFAPQTIKSGGSSTLTFTLANPTGVAQTAGAFTDTLANMQVSANQTVGGSCTWTPSAPTLTAGQTALSFTGINIPTSGCTISLTVTSSTGGVQSNATSSGVSTALLPAGPVSSPANLTVIAPAAIAKSFSPSTIETGQSSTITFTLTNPNSIPLTGASFSDTLTGMQVYAAGAAGGSCAGASGNSFTAGQTGTLNFTGLTIPTGGAGCTVTVNVTSTTASPLATGYPNTASGVASNEANTGSPSNSASLVVAAPAAITKGFGTSPIVPGGTSLITFTLDNPSAIPLTGASFSDTLTGMQVSAAGPAGGSCTGAGSNNFVAGQTGTITFSGLTIPASPATCTVTLTVTAPSAGSFPNTAGGVTANETPVAGSGSNTATLTVLYPPQIANAFSPGSIQIGTGQYSTVTLTLTNPNAGNALSSVAFTDTLTNLQIAATGTAGGTCTGASGNSFTAGQTGALSFSGISIPAGGSCTVTFRVTGTTISPAAGYPNATSGATSVSGTLTLPAGSPSNTAYLTTLQAPTITKSFNPGALTGTGNSVITFTLTNPNPTPLTGAEFSDPLPTNMSIPAGSTTPQNYIASCSATGAPAGTGTCTGTIPCGNPNTNGTAQTGTITWSGTTIPANSSCTITVTVRASTNNTNYTNTVGGITTDQTPVAGPGWTDTLSVTTVDTVKSFATANVLTNTTVNAKFTLTNNSGTSRNGTVTFVDTFPAGMTLAALPAANPCGSGSSFKDQSGGTLAVGDGGFTLVAGTLARNGGTCTFTVPVKMSNNGTYYNTTGSVYSGATLIGPTSNTASVTAQDQVVLAKSFNPSSIDLYDSSTITYTLTNPNTFALTDATFTDTFAKNPTSLAAGYTVSAAAYGGTCAGVTGVPAVGASTVSPTVATLLPGSCTITVPVTSAEQTGPFPIAYGSASLTGVTVDLGAGQTTGAVPATIPTLTVNKLPITVVKTANTANSNPGGTVGYTISYTNPNNSMSLTNLVFTDVVPTYSSFQSASCGPLPASLTTCNISAPAVGGKGTVTWTMGGALNAGASGNLYINVKVD